MSDHNKRSSKLLWFLCVSVFLSFTENLRSIISVKSKQGEKVKLGTYYREAHWHSFPSLSFNSFFSPLPTSSSPFPPVLCPIKWAWRLKLCSALMGFMTSWLTCRNTYTHTHTHTQIRYTATWNQSAKHTKIHTRAAMSGFSWQRSA